jgi:hypothetical protein
VDHQELLPAVKLARLLHPELYRRAISEQCYDGPSAMMTHREIILWLLKKNATEVMLRGVFNSCHHCHKKFFCYLFF